MGIQRIINWVVSVDDEMNLNNHSIDILWAMAEPPAYEDCFWLMFPASPVCEYLGRVETSGGED